MPRRGATPLVSLTLSVLVIGALAGCTVPADERPTPAPTDSAGPVATEVDAAWLDGGRLVGVVTEGSSTCLPTGVIGPYSDGVLQVTLFDDPDAVCTRDLVPQVTLVGLPVEVDRADDLEIIVTGAGYDGDVTLSGLEAAVPEGPSDQLPSAGWTTTAGAFIVLLWGSSGCPEYVTATEVTGEAAITASLSGIPADKACTADVAPNPQLTSVDGPTARTGVELTLTGPDAEPFTTPILGVRPDSDD